MAISYVGAGLFSAGTADVSPAAYPSGSSASDIALGFFTTKPATIDGTAYTDTRLGAASSGTIAAGNDTGSVRASAYARMNPGTANGTISVSYVGNNVTGRQGLRFANATGYWTVDQSGLEDTVETGTTVSASGTATSQIAAGDWVVVHVAVKSDAINHSLQMVDIPGVTLGTWTWLAKSSTTAGTDLAMYLGYAQVLLGASTGTITYTATSSVSGGSATAVNLVKLREKQPPAAPTGLSATVAANSVDLSWTAASGVTTYEVVRNGTVIASPSATTYSDTTAYPGTAYTYVVRSVLDGIRSADSSSATATTGSLTLSAAPDVNSVVLSWNNPAGTSPTSYTVRRTVPALAESFNTPDTTVLGPDLTWTELPFNAGSSDVVNAQAVLTGTTNSAASRNRAEHDVAVDQFSEITIGALSRATGTYASAGAAVRFSPTEQSYYEAAREHDANGYSFWIRKMAAGSASDITTKVYRGATSDGDVVRCEAVGSTIRAYLNGELLRVVTDTSYPTGRVGFQHQRGVSAGTSIVDNFAAGNVARYSVATPTTAYDDTAVVAGTTYTYTVALVLGDGSESPASNAVATSLVEGPPAYTYTAGLTGGGQLTTPGVPAVGQSALLTGSGSLGAPAKPGTSTTATLSGSGDLAASGQVIQKESGSATLSGSGSLGSTGTPAPALAAGLAGSGSLGVAATPSVQATALLAGSGQFTTLGVLAVGQATPLGGSGSLTAAGKPVASTAATLSGGGQLTGSGSAVQVASGTVTLTGTGALNLTGTVSSRATAPLTGSGTLAGSATPRFSASAALSGAGSLTTNSTAALVVAAGLTGSGSLAVGVSPATSSSAALTGSGALAATGSALATASTSLPLSGEGALTASSTAALSRAAVLSGSGSLTTTTGVAVSAAALLVGSGALVVSGAPAAAGGVVLSGAGSLAASASSTGAAAAVPLAGSGSLGIVSAVVASSSALLAGAGQLTGVGSSQQLGSGTASFAGTGALASGSDVRVSALATLAGSGVLQMAGGPATFAAAAFVGSGSLATADEPGVTGAALFAGTGALSTTVGAHVAPSAALAGSGALTVAGATPVFGDVFLAGSGALLASVRPAATVAAVLSGDGALGGAPRPGLRVAVAMSGAGRLEVVGVEAAASHAMALAGSGQLVAATAAAAAAMAVLSGGGSLLSAGVMMVSAVVALAGSGELTTGGVARSARVGIRALQPTTVGGMRPGGRAMTPGRHLCTHGLVRQMHSSEYGTMSPTPGRY